MEDHSVPVQDQQENEFFQYIDNQHQNNIDVSPLRNSAYSVRQSSAIKQTSSFQNDQEDISRSNEYDQGAYFLKMLQEKQLDNRVQTFLKQVPEYKTHNQPVYETQGQSHNNEPNDAYNLYQKMMNSKQQPQSEDQYHYPNTNSMPMQPYYPQQEFMTKPQQMQYVQQKPQQPQQLDLTQQFLQQSLIQSQFLQDTKQNRSEVQTPANEKNSNEIFTMYNQIISFYDKNLSNLKNIIIQKDQELSQKDEKNKELQTLVQQMKSSFQHISQKYETENQELMNRYMQNIEEYGGKRLNEEQRSNSEKEQIMKEFVLLKQHHVDTNLQKMNLEIRVKDLEVKHSADQIRISDYRLKIEYLQNDINELQQQKVQIYQNQLKQNLLEQQNIQLLQQFDILKEQHFTEVSRIIQQQQENLVQKNQIQNSQYQQLYQQHLQAQSFNQNILQPNQQQNIAPMQSRELHKQIGFPGLDSSRTQPQTKSQNFMPIQSAVQNQQSNHPQLNHQGILGFPSDQKYYNQMDEVNNLHKDLQELSSRKQQVSMHSFKKSKQIESELNKKTQGSKTIVERRKKEQQEKELEELTDQINLVKLKLRDFKQF